jgi:hypothetical protein
MRSMLMIILERSMCTAGTEKKRSLSESRGDHIGGGQNQQNSLGGPERVQYNWVIILEGCSVIGVLLWVHMRLCLHTQVLNHVH